MPGVGLKGLVLGGAVSGTVCGFAGWVDFNEQRLGAGEDFAGGVEDAGLGVVLAAIALNGAGLNADARSRRDRAQVVDLDVAGHGRESLGADCLAHGFVKERGDDAAMEDAVRTFKRIRNGGQGDDGAVPGDEEFEAQTRGVGLTAAEAAVLSGVKQRLKVFSGSGCHTAIIRWWSGWHGAGRRWLDRRDARRSDLRCGFARGWRGVAGNWQADFPGGFHNFNG